MVGIFFIVLITEFATIPIIYRRPHLGGIIGILAAILNIVLVVADQAHVLQPEVAHLSYSILQGMIVIASVALAYLSWIVYYYFTIMHYSSLFGSYSAHIPLCPEYRYN